MVIGSCNSVIKKFNMDIALTYPYPVYVILRVPPAVHIRAVGGVEPVTQHGAGYTWQRSVKCHRSGAQPHASEVVQPPISRNILSQSLEEDKSDKVGQELYLPDISESTARYQPPFSATHTT